MGEIQLQGTLGKTVTVCGNCIKIKPSRNSNSIKTILIDKIIQVSVKKPTIFKGGYIHFQTGNIDEGILGINDVVSDPNAILFNAKEKYEIALNIKRYIEDYNSKINSNADNLSIADEINKLKNLLDQGIINQEQFEKQKSKLLE